MTACKDPDPFIPSALKASTVLTPRGASVQLFVDSNGNYTKQAINQMAFDIAGFGAHEKNVKYGSDNMKMLSNREEI